MPTIFKDYEDKQKKSIEEQTAGAPTQAPASIPYGQASLGGTSKALTPEEEARRAKKLAMLLRNRKDD